MGAVRCAGRPWGYADARLLVCVQATRGPRGEAQARALLEKFAVGVDYKVACEQVTVWLDSSLTSEKVDFTLDKGEVHARPPRKNDRR